MSVLPILKNRDCLILWNIAKTQYSSLNSNDFNEALHKLPLMSWFVYRNVCDCLVLPIRQFKVLIFFEILPFKQLRTSRIRVLLESQIWRVHASSCMHNTMWCLQKEKPNTRIMLIEWLEHWIKQTREDIIGIRVSHLWIFSHPF